MKRVIFSLAIAAMGFLAQAQTYNVTFQVDLGANPVSPNGVHIAGSLQSEAGAPGDWDPSTTALTNVGGSIYAVTLTLPAGDYEYKFINGNAWGTDEGVPGACAVNGNRGITVSADITLAPVCFGACGACLVQSPTNVTFNIDMRNVETVAPVVSVAGSLQVDAGFPNNWSPGATVLTDGDGDGIYTVTLSVLSNKYYDYKFINGDAWGPNEHIPCDCVKQGTDNRELFVTGDTTISFCYNQCPEMCTMGSAFVVFRTDMSQVLPGVVTVRYADDQYGPDTLMQGMGFMYETMPIELPLAQYGFSFGNDGQWETDNDIAACTCSGFNGKRRELDLTMVAPGSTVIVDAYEFNTCTITSPGQVLTGLNNIADQLGMSIVPNPFSNETTITFANNGGEYMMEVTTLLGQVVKREAGIRNNTITLNSDNLAAGMYFVSLLDEQGNRATRKVIVE